MCVLSLLKQSGLNDMSFLSRLDNFLSNFFSYWRKVSLQCLLNLLTVVQQRRNSINKKNIFRDLSLYIVILAKILKLVFFNNIWLFNVAIAQWSPSLILFSIGWEWLEPFQAVIGRVVGYTPDRPPVSCRASTERQPTIHTHINSQFRVTNNLNR